MSKKFFGRSARKRNSGLSMRIDNWEKLQFLVNLMKSSLPINISMDLNHGDVSRRPTPPLPYDPRTESSTTIPTPLPFLAEVRVSLSIDETLAWVLQVQFCIDQLLTAREVITKLADALGFLDGWSKVHGREGREHLRTQRLEAHRPGKSRGSPFVQ